MRMGIAEWFRGRRVFLTGHTGFKGSWLAVWLRDAGADVTGYALPPEAGRPSLFASASVADGLRSILGDVRDSEALRAAMGTSRPEIVLHLAAQSLVRRSYAQPVDTIATNVVGTAQLLEAVRHQSTVRAVVVVTSDKCYENRGLDRGYVESDPMGGYDPYSASKGCQELVTAAFRRSFLDVAGIPVATARAGNVVGGGDWCEDRLMVDLMLAAGTNQVATIRNPHAVRPWQFVLEPLRGYLMLAQALAEQGSAFAGAWNFGPAFSDAVSVGELVGRVTAEWPRVRAQVVDSPGAPHEAHLLQLDSSKAAQLLGWFPALSLNDTVAMTVGWYKAVAENPDCASAVLRQQLLEYVTRAESQRPSSS